MAKKNGFIKEFKEFISRGSVIDLAVGVIIGGAFQKIVNSLVNDIIMPVISLVTGGIDFNNWFLPLGKGDFATAADAKAAGVATLNYGTFIGTAREMVKGVYNIPVYQGDKCAEGENFKAARRGKIGAYNQNMPLLQE